MTEQSTSPMLLNVYQHGALIISEPLFGYTMTSSDLYTILT